jgi:hypothetical protein
MNLWTSVAHIDSIAPPSSKPGKRVGHRRVLANVECLSGRRSNFLSLRATLWGQSRIIGLSSGRTNTDPSGVTEAEI